MTNSKLFGVTSLADQFFKAAMHASLDDPELSEKVKASMSPEEMDGLWRKIQEIDDEYATYAIGEVVPDSHAQKVLKLVDITAKYFSRAVPVEKLASWVPEELKSDENVAYLRELGANNIANISDFKPK